MPPPSCIGILIALRMAATARAFTGLPAKAPSRSTRCSHSKPAASNAARLRRRIAVEHGGARHVASFEPHRFAVLEIDRRKEDHGFHAQKIRQQRKTKALALLGMELRAREIVARDHRRDRAAIIGLGDEIGFVRRLQLIGVHEIGVQALGPSAIPSRSAWPRLSASVFQPMCGILSGCQRARCGRPRRRSSPSPRSPRSRVRAPP